MKIYEKIISILVLIIVCGIGIFTAYTTITSNRDTTAKIRTLSDSIGRIEDGQLAIAKQNLLIEQRFEKLGSAVSNLGTTVSGIGTQISTVKAGIQSLGNGIQSLKDGLPELEAIVRQSNDRIDEASGILTELKNPIK